MKIKTFSQLLQETYDGYNYMCKKYPKAARKRRIRNKWRNRFGPGIAGLINQPGFITQIPKDNIWNTNFVIQLSTEDKK